MRLPNFFFKGGLIESCLQISHIDLSLHKNVVKFMFYSMYELKKRVEMLNHAASPLAQKSFTKTIKKI